LQLFLNMHAGIYFDHEEDTVQVFQGRDQKL